MNAKFDPLLTQDDKTIFEDIQCVLLMERGSWVVSIIWSLELN